VIEIFKNGSILDQNSFFFAPFHKSIDLIVEKRTPDNLFQEILGALLNFFSEIKQHRTILDVEEAFKKIEEILNLKNLEDLDDESMAEESDILKGDLKDFIANNIEKINLSIDDGQTGFMVNYWISNLEIAFETFGSALKEFRRKYRFLSKKSSRAKDLLKDKLNRIYKALFLVFFRIMEQIYMISENMKFIPDKEISYLIEDVVYLENIVRATQENIYYY